jgi:hypothetical protein
MKFKQLCLERVSSPTEYLRMTPGPGALKLHS